MTFFYAIWRQVGAPLLVVALLSVGTPFSAMAQTSDGGISNEELGSLPEHLTRADVRDLMSRLSDDQVRDLLIQQLDKTADDEASAAADANAVEGFEKGLDRLRDGSVNMVDALPRVPTIFGFAIDHMTAGKGPTHVWIVLVFLAIILAAATAIPVSPTAIRAPIRTRPAMARAAATVIRASPITTRARARTPKATVPAAKGPFVAW